VGHFSSKKWVKIQQKQHNNLFQKYSKLIHPFLFIATIYKDYPLLEKLISKFHNNEFEKKEEDELERLVF
jgi:hypothetical protein